MLNLPGHTQARLPADHPPVLTVVVDTEEEFDWSQPFSRDSTRTASITAQPLAHERLFDALGVVPTYVMDWPVANDPAAIRTLGGLLAQGRCDIGTHLHPWVSPPHAEEVNRYNSYAGNLPAELEYEKIRLLTETIEHNFGQRPRIFKAGRYGVGPATAQHLARLGYDIDASVVPQTNLTADGGPDFSRHGHDPFWFRAGGQQLLEVPVTAGYAGRLHRHGHGLYARLQRPWARRLRLPGIASRLGVLERVRLSPEGYTAAELIRLTECMLAQGCRVFGLSYHSPTLVPGNTAYVRDGSELERFLDTLGVYLTHFSQQLGGRFLSVRALKDTLQQAA
jgi:hypothetical protein